MKMNRIQFMSQSCSSDLAVVGTEEREEAVHNVKVIMQLQGGYTKLNLYITLIIFCNTGKNIKRQTSKGLTKIQYKHF